MVKVISKRLLFNIKLEQLCLCFLVFFTLIGCNRIKEVEVQVIDVETMAGIGGINVYYGEKQYVKDSRGKDTIEGRNMKGAEVSINRDIRGYTTPEVSNTCQFKQVYTIESKNLVISLLKLRVLKLVFSSKNNESMKGCLVVNDLENCNSFLDFYYEFTNGKLIHPSGANKKGNEFTMYMNKPPEYWKLEFYNENFCDVVDVSGPDYSELVYYDSNQDTTFYTVNLR